ncbi:MAG: HD domain-containing protein [Ruminococcus sp.]|nr:HD domain-containing protein [Ruminococcus sp.]
MNLEITNRILENLLYRQELQKLEELEKDRIFCRHGIEHSFDTARIAIILCRENGIEINPDIIYSSALLHDLGRSQEYTEKIPHHTAGVCIANKILDDIDCPDDIKKSVLRIIGNHRNPDNDPSTPEYIFYTADKKSRLCFMCPARNECYWSDEKKNMKPEV